ncbi:TadE/TadG family type IV pilus assembly protein [Erythrobacter sp. sf7]|uniref:TadE/TadG family type IV pilus assembly protein n=1 Tax=Erythrobacter fulvus TaxID=2987523 RepID=A0ABT5JRV2_9SPHN|nr:TadE/TadG family type IV pilus assembly protein [Erythrobacter fulvus]MDC8754811.1 TadE/TadG family type IV pilus assembly protein [Erythrobacter fulvus]
MNRLHQLWRDRRGASAAEFALVLPAALLLLFGIIDVGNYAWTLNEYEKATQMGARYAVVTNVLSPALEQQTYVGQTCNGATLRAGDRICREALGTIECNSTGCQCAEAPCPASNLSPASNAAFLALVNRMRTFQPAIAASTVRVTYRGSGLGYAGDPNKPEIAPLVTVRVVNATYVPITLSPLGIGVPLPDFSYSLTLEDGEGATSS